jgi:cyclic pyranopterin phosphate synthase
MQTKKPKLLIDAHRRPINYLRVSVTDRCNLRCRYCTPLEPNHVKREQLLTLEEIHRLIRIAAQLGMNKIRLTGGEPLVRKGIPELIQRIGQIKEIQDIALTTNGTLLPTYGERLRQAGLNRVNISLDTLDREKFRSLTGFDSFDKVWKGIMTAMDLGFDPIKINVVVMKDFNDQEIEDLARLTFRYPFHIRFIEYMPIGIKPYLVHQYSVTVTEIEKRLQKIGPLMPVQSSRVDGPAKRFRFQGAMGEIGLIGSMTAHFCAQCNRLRLTSTGCLRPCLLSDEQVDVMGALRGGADDEKIEKIFKDIVSQKKLKHHLNFDAQEALQSKMVNIGG